MSKAIKRRKFLTDISLSVTGSILGSTLTGCTFRADHEVSSYEIMKDVRKYRKMDAHTHIFSDKDIEGVLDHADRLGIEKLQISKPVTNYSGNEPEGPEIVRECNNVIISAIKKHPDRFIGFFTLNPRYTKESLEELKRCVDQGMAGYKGYTQVKINDPLYYPVIEQLIDLKMICLMHAELELGVAGYRMKYDIQERAHATIPEDMAEAARRYPEAMFQWPHIASGDFEYICKCIRECPNIYVDVSGSNNEEKQVDFCIEQLGEDRILFGSDGSYYQAVGKILSSSATESQKKKIFFENFNNILRKGGHHVA
jgi:predicted TIM-barrel fold metal-dependent hydrolase